jgi:hypothetical protein
MDELKSKTNVKSCGECAVICYIFRVMYGKIVFVEIYNKSVWIQVLDFIREYCCFNNQNTKYYTEWVVGDLCFTRSFCVLCNPSPYLAWPICRLIWPSMLSLSESKLSPWEWSRVPCSIAECLGIQQSAMECSRVPPSL